MPVDKDTRHRKLDAVLKVHGAMHEARQASWSDVREPCLVRLMHMVGDLPEQERNLGERAAVFTAALAMPGKSAIGMAAKYLFAGVDRPRSNAGRLIKALGIGGMTRSGPFQNRVLDRTEDLYRRLAKTDPESAETIAYAALRGIGIASNADFSRKLRERLGPEFTPSNPSSSKVRLRSYFGEPAFGKPAKPVRSL